MDHLADGQYCRDMTRTQVRRAMLDKLERLHRSATQCRYLAETALTAEGRQVLLGLALDYEYQAATLQDTGTGSPAHLDTERDKPLFRFSQEPS